MADVKWSQFPSAIPSNSDEVVGLKSGRNVLFSIANIVAAVRNGLANIFVPKTDVGAANGVASLDSNGKVPGTQLDLSGKQDTITENGILKGDGQGGVTAATPGADYATPAQLVDKAAKADLTSIQATGTTNTTGAVIPAGAYFYLKGVLHRANTQIDVNATFTPGTNCEPWTVGDALAFTTYTGTPATNTVPGTSYTVINAVSLPSGKYLIVGSASNGTNVSGTLALTITNATAGVNVATNRTSTENGGGNTVCAIIELTVTSTIRLRATQTTGSSLSLNTNSMTAIKLA